jgi:hypothetical protein
MLHFGEIAIDPLKAVKMSLSRSDTDMLITAVATSSLQS